MTTWRSISGLWVGLRPPNRRRQPGLHPLHLGLEFPLCAQYQDDRDDGAAYGDRNYGEGVYTGHGLLLMPSDKAGPGSYQIETPLVEDLNLPGSAGTSGMETPFQPFCFGALSRSG